VLNTPAAASAFRRALAGPTVPEGVMTDRASPSPTSSGQIRVFISSTFRDMHAEQDHLVRFVFPRLREEMLTRRIHLIDVDLRCGVTSDQDVLGSAGRLPSR
jgi:hypothetical protein